MDWSENFLWNKHTRFLASPICIGQAQWRENTWVKGVSQDLSFGVGLPSWLEGVLCFACQIKLSCNWTVTLVRCFKSLLQWDRTEEITHSPDRQEDLDRLQSKGSQIIRHYWVTKHSTHSLLETSYFFFFLSPIISNKWDLNTCWILLTFCNFLPFGFLYFFPSPPTSKQNKNKQKTSIPNTIYNPACHLHIPFLHDYRAFKIYAILC